MEIKRNGLQPGVQGNSEGFTGTVRSATLETLRQRSECEKASRTKAISTFIKVYWAVSTTVATAFATCSISP